MGDFDSWLYYRIVVYLDTIRKEKKLKAVAALELKMLQWTEIYLISEDLQWRYFIELELKDSALRYIIQQKRELHRSRMQR